MRLRNVPRDGVAGVHNRVRSHPSRLDGNFPVKYVKKGQFCRVIYIMKWENIFVFSSPMWYWKAWLFRWMYWKRNELYIYSKCLSDVNSQKLHIFVISMYTNFVEVKSYHQFNLTWNCNLICPYLHDVIKANNKIKKTLSLQRTTHQIYRHWSWLPWGPIIKEQNALIHYINLSTYLISDKFHQ